MTKFGRFENGASEPIETYEADYMRSQNSHVRLFRGGVFLDSDQFADLVVTIRLGKAQSVREIETAETPKKVKRRKANAGALPVSSEP